MRRKTTYIGTVIGSALLCLCMLVGMFVPAAAGETLPSLDYGIAGREDNTTYSTLELYEALFETQPTDADGAYLGTTDITFTYNSNVPNSLLSTEYNSETGTLAVAILPYTYVAANGETVTWLPQSATIDGEELTLTEENGVYRCGKDNLFYSEDFDMQVKYAWSVTIPEEIIRELRTVSFRTGSAALATLSEYEQAHAQYTAAMERYEAWQEYLAWKQVYDAYLEEAEAYRVAKEAYDAYCRDYAQYEKDLDHYEAWQEYFDYSEATADKIEAYNKYMAYLTQMEPVTAKLALLESLFVSDSNGWQMYGSIMGGSVTEVLLNEDLLVNKLGYGESFIRLAGDSTVELRKLLPEYAKLRNAKYDSEHDRVAALYGYYAKNYQALKTNFTNLYSVLYELYQDATVMLYIMGSGKQAHYVQFVGQLYVVSTCLDENGNRNSSWKIFNGKADVGLSAVVEPIHLLKDGVWDPSTSPMPEKADYAEYVAPMDPPAGDPPSKRPVEPVKVDNPGDAPIEPENPYQHGIPTEEEHPGEAPVAPVFDTLTLALMEEIRTGVLTEYQGSMNPVTLSFETVAQKTVSIRNLKTVSFYDAHGNFLESFQINYGESINYPLPERESTAQYHYHPIGWISIDGSSVDLVSVTGDLSLMPAYSKQLRAYTVTWILDGEVVTETRYYDDKTLPTPPAKWSLATREQGHYRYTFSGWDTEIKPVTGDATYRGEMIKTLRDYTVTWVLYGDKVVTETWQAFSTPIFTGDTSRPADSRTYRFIGWKGPLGTLQGDTVYTAQYESTKLALGGSGAVMDVVHRDTEIAVHATVPSLDISAAVDFALEEGKTLSVLWDGGFSLFFNTEELEAFDHSDCRHIVLQRTEEGPAVRYELNFYSSAWKQLDKMSGGMTVTLPYERSEDRETVFFIMGENGWERISDRTVRVAGSTQFRRVYSYDISVAPNKQCNTVSMQTQAVAGERVSLKLKCVFGYEVSGAKVLDAAGNVIPVDKDLTFLMPEGPVSITLDVTEIKYTVTFIVNGKVVSSAVYALNEEIKVPEAPAPESHDGYVYTFISWGDVPAVAAGSVRDMVFEATFSRAQENVDYDAGDGGSMLFDVYLPIAGVVILLLIGGLITWRVLKKRKKKKAAEEAAQNAEASEKDETDDAEK